MQKQPSLLLYSSVGETVGSKLARLQELTGEEEWAALVGGASLHRILTCSLERIETRLRQYREAPARPAPALTAQKALAMGRAEAKRARGRPAGTGGKGVAWVILTTESQFDTWLRARGWGAEEEAR